MGILDGLAGASITERGNFFKKDKNYLLEVRKTQLKDTQRSGTCMIIEFRVLQSDDDGFGESGTWINSLKNRSAALSNLKEFIAAVYGIEKSDREGIATLSQNIEAFAEGCFAKPDANDLIGRQVLLATRGTKTKAGGDFTIHNWSPAPG